MSRREQKALPSWKVTDTSELLKAVFETRYFKSQNGEEPVIPYKWDPGSLPLVLVVGENASGKSFFRRLVSGVCQYNEPRWEAIPISMEGRGDSFGGLRSFVYGSETDESTGYNSVGTVLTGIKTSEARQQPHMIFWDEPDLGLSDNYAAGLGRTLNKFARNPPPHLKAAFVVTHSKALLSQLGAAAVHFVALGDGPLPETLEQYLAQPVTPIDPEVLREKGRARWLRINKMLNEGSK